jgi:hypothetical protein
MLFRIALILPVIFLLTAPVQARNHHRHHYYHLVHKRHFYAQKQQSFQQFAWFSQQAETPRNQGLLQHPAGCPRSAFCGCGASVELFGHPVRSLYLAANWYRFPRTYPAPNTVGVRRHHVFVLKQHIRGDVWLVYDANSGHHATRLHARSISGYTIVNPH